MISCNNSSEQPKKDEQTVSTPKLKEENISYKLDSLTMDGYVVYDENITGKRPAILVVHEWWGLNDYVKSRARQLAELGYIAMAIDMYGNGKRAVALAVRRHARALQRRPDNRALEARPT